MNRLIALIGLLLRQARWQMTGCFVEGDLVESTEDSDLVPEDTLGTVLAEKPCERYYPGYKRKYWVSFIIHSDVEDTEHPVQISAVRLVDDDQIRFALNE